MFLTHLQWQTWLAVLLALTFQISPATAAADGPWVRLSPIDLTTANSSNADERRRWGDRLEAGTRKWNASAQQASAIQTPYPLRTQVAVLQGPNAPVVVSALAGMYECSPTGTFDKSDLFTWCAMRVQGAGVVKTIDPACWIESEPDMIPDPAQYFMRARLTQETAGLTVLIQTIQAGKPVPACTLRVPLP